jgi:general secretion pathway protein M
MKEWWNNLSLRDKRIASSGIIMIVMIAFYMLIWLPLANKNERLRTEVQHDKQLLIWMQAANQHIQSLKKNNLARQNSISSASLLSTLQNSIQQSPLKNKITQLKQSENDSVQLNAQSINFDELISWLIKIWEEQGMSVSQLSIVPQGPIGNVNAEIRLKKI